MKPAERVVAEAHERRGKQVGRLASYRRCAQAYFGEAGGGGGGGVIGSDSGGMPLLKFQSTREQLGQRKGAPNFIRPMVDDLVSVRGQLPTSTVTPESRGETDEGVALKRTRALRQQWQQSRMEVLQPELVWYATCMGDAVYTLDPRLPGEVGQGKDPFKQPGVMIRVVNPSMAFPEFLNGDDPRELNDLYLIYELSRGDVKRDYGWEPGKEKVEAVHLYSRTEKQVVVDGRRVAGVEHGLGFCPAQWITNKPTDGRQAQSDIVGALDLHDELQAMWYVYTDSLVWSVYPLIEVRNPQNVAGDNVEIGPGAMVTTIGDGAINFHAPTGNPQAARLIFESAFDNLLKIVGVAPVRIEGQIDRSNVSARSVHAQQGGMHNRIAMAQTVLGYHIEKLNGKIMQMMYRVPELRMAEMSTWGVDDQGNYHDTFSGNDMGGWWRNTVAWDAWLGSDRHERLVMALQLFKERIVSPRKVLEEWGEDDPEGTLEEAKRYFAVTDGGSGHPGGLPPGGGPPAPGVPPPGGLAGSPGASPPDGGATQAGEEMVALASGGLGGGREGPAASRAPMVQPPPPMPGGAAMPGFAPIATAPGQRGLGAATPVPDYGREMDRVLRTLPLHGRMAGPGLVPGILVRHPRGRGLYVEVADWRDIGMVRRAMQDLATQLFGEAGNVTVKVAPWLRGANGGSS